MPKIQPEFITEVKRRAIMAMFSDDELMERLVLKGGNLLDLIYGVSARSSVDIDFSVAGELGTADTLRARLENTLEQTFREIGYEVFDLNVYDVPPNLSADMKDVWGGYQVNFKIIEQRLYQQFMGSPEKIRRNAAGIGKRGSTKFEIDISNHEYCDHKQAFEFAHLTIYGYTPPMMICEKLRAICQQMPEYVEKAKRRPSARARDFVDIFVVATQFHLDFDNNDIQQILPDIFAAKRVPLRLLKCVSDYREYHRPDYELVKATVKPDFLLRGFDAYFDFVVAEIEKLTPLLKSLGNE